jgi:hypothetical protein
MTESRCLDETSILRQQHCRPLPVANEHRDQHRFSRNMLGRVYRQMIVNWTPLRIF